MTTQPNQTHWVYRISTWGTRSLTVVAVLALVFTMVNVQTFAAAGHDQTTFQWWIAWLLDPMASITMGTAIVFESLLAEYDRSVTWLTATKWCAGIATWGMNIWAYLTPQVIPSGVWLHSVAPGLILLLAEAAPRVRRHLAEISAGMETTTPVPTNSATPAPRDTPTDVPGCGCAPAPWVEPVPTVYQPPKAVPNPEPVPTRTHLGTDAITPDLVARARAYRADLIKKGQPVGRDVLRAHFQLTDRQARALVAHLNADTPLKAVPGGTR
jgi:hypothetical protein